MATLSRALAGSAVVAGGSVQASGRTRSVSVAAAPSSSRSAVLRSGLSAGIAARPIASRTARRTAGEGKDSTACNASLFDLIGGDLIWPDLGDWNTMLEEEGAIGVYAPPEGGYEGRYAGQCKVNGYKILNVNARGLGDLEAYLMKPHGVRPPHLGKQAIVRFDEPGLLQMRLDAMPATGDGSKGIVLWVQEAKVLTNNEIQYLALLPDLDPRIKVVAEVGSQRYFQFKPLRECTGLAPVM